MMRYAAALCLVAACSPPSASESMDPVVVDSAGVEVVTYPPAVRDGPVVGLEALPMTEARAGRNLGSVLHGLILGTGDVVLVDGQTRTVHEYAPDGSHVRTQGGEGGGPGEYEFIRGVGRCRGSGFVVFNIDWTMNFHDDVGTWVRSERVPLAEGSPYHMACGPDGTLAMTFWGRADARPGSYVSMSSLRIVDSAGKELADLGARVGADRIRRQTDDLPHPIGRSTRLAFQDHDLIVSDGQFFGFERWSRDGTLKGIVRVDVAPPDADSLMALYREYILGRAPNDDVRVRFRNQIREYGLPEQVAFLSDLFVSPDWIFVRETNVADGGRWFVFSGDGVPQGFLEVPPGSRFLDVVGDTVLLAQRDSLDVAYAGLYRLRLRR